VIFDRATWPALRAVSPASGAREVVHSQGAALAEVAVEDPWVLVDADTPADHEAMRRGETQ
jgi:CTP:molybdopterin cytidylyltransferase MocA